MFFGSIAFASAMPQSHTHVQLACHASAASNLGFGRFMSKAAQ